jgi:hypothetical protein
MPPLLANSNVQTTAGALSHGGASGSGDDERTPVLNSNQRINPRC